MRSARSGRDGTELTWWRSAGPVRAGPGVWRARPPGASGGVSPTATRGSWRHAKMCFIGCPVPAQDKADPTDLVSHLATHGRVDSEETWLDSSILDLLKHSGRFLPVARGRAHRGAERSRPPDRPAHRLHTRPQPFPWNVKKRNVLSCVPLRSVPFTCVGVVLCSPSGFREAGRVGVLPGSPLFPTPHRPGVPAAVTLAHPSPSCRRTSLCGRGRGCHCEGGPRLYSLQGDAYRLGRSVGTTDGCVTLRSETPGLLLGGLPGAKGSRNSCVYAGCSAVSPVSQAGPRVK